MEASKQCKTKMDKWKSFPLPVTSPSSTLAPSVPQSFNPTPSLPHFQEEGKSAPTEPTTENTIYDPSKPTANQINTHHFQKTQLLRAKLGQGICGTWGDKQNKRKTPAKSFQFDPRNQELWKASSSSHPSTNVAIATTLAKNPNQTNLNKKTPIFCW